MKSNLLALWGALVGGVVGYVLFFWFARQGFYALALPGGLVGLGAGVVANRSRGVAVACGVAALILGALTEYQFAPFKADASAAYFLTHLQQLQPVTLLLIGVGGCLGFYVPFRRYQPDDAAPPAGRRQ